mgnify:CR=1 FL=1
MNEQLVPLFPTLVYSEIIPEEYIQLTPELEKHSNIERKINLLEEDYGRVSNNTHLLHLPEFKEFKLYVEKLINKYVWDVLCYDYKENQITQSWISIKYPNQSHTSHFHPNSVVSGIFFWEKMDPNHPGVTFSKHESSNNVHVLNIEKRKDIPDPFVINYHPDPGSIILFPSYLHHNVDLNSTSTPRKSLAFNSVPKNILGEEGSLTELKVFNYD